ncbi:MAG: hypothetical protein ABI423_13485, partial [Burkholderiales bacterium]
VLSIVISTLAFFVAGFFLKRWADDNGFPKGMTLNISLFVAAIAISYAVAWIVDKVAALASP